jgi:kynurenine formamidase
MITGGVNKPVKNESLQTIEEHGVLSTGIELTTQCYTHMDVPRHWTEDGKSVDQIDPEKFVGDAVVFDMSHKNPGETVTAQDLKRQGKDVREDDIAIIGTGWTDDAWGTKRFWTDMICLSDDAGTWLLENGIKGLAQDFYTGPFPLSVCDSCGGLEPGITKHPNHEKFLENGVILYEFCTNIQSISEDRVEFIGLPLKLKGTDGAPIRVIVRE